MARRLEHASTCRDAKYILLAAGTSFLSEKFRFTKYKLWMRTVLVLWRFVLLLGLATYARWYDLHLFRK